MDGWSSSYLLIDWTDEGQHRAIGGPAYEGGRTIQNSYIFLKRNANLRPGWINMPPNPHNLGPGGTLPRQEGEGIIYIKSHLRTFSNWRTRPIGMAFQYFLFYLITKPGSGLHIRHFRQAFYFCLHYSFFLWVANNLALDGSAWEPTALAL